MKDLYRNPEMEIVHLEDVDVITTSSVMDDDELPDLVIG